MSFGRDILRDVQGYVPGEQPRTPGLIKLNTNENPYPPSPRVMEAVQRLAADAIKNYPDPLSVDLRRACAEAYGYPDETWVIAGNGMDEILAQTLRTFVDPGDPVVSVSPTYVLYETLVQLHGATLVQVPLNDGCAFSNQLFESNGRLAFIPRPNSPTGQCASRGDMETFCESFRGIVLIDEAYADFADDSCMDFPKRFDNVIVTRTFSKAYSLAGMRLGIGVAQPALILEFLKTKDSYNIDAATQAAGLAAIRDAAWMEANVEKIKRTRATLIEALRELNFDVPSSESNFVLATPPDDVAASDVFTALRADNILVRHFDTAELKQSLRISVGTDKQNATLLEALTRIVRQ